MQLNLKPLQGGSMLSVRKPKLFSGSLMAIIFGIVISFFRMDLNANSFWHNGEFWVWDIDQNTSMGGDWSGVIRIMADNVKLNMNGYYVNGPNTNICILVSDRSGVRIYDGYINNCNTGIYFESGEKDTVQNVYTDCTSWGIRCDYTDKVLIEDCYGTTDAYDGILLISSESPEIYYATYTDCGRSGIWLDGCWCPVAGSSTLNLNAFDGITLNYTYGAFISSNTTNVNGEGLNRHGVGLFNSSYPYIISNNSNFNACYGYYQTSCSNITSGNNSASNNACGSSNF